MWFVFTARSKGTFSCTPSSLASNGIRPRQASCDCIGKKCVKSRKRALLINLCRVPIRFTSTQRRTSRITPAGQRRSCGPNNGGRCRIPDPTGNLWLRRSPRQHSGLLVTSRLMLGKVRQRPHQSGLFPTLLAARTNLSKLCSPLISHQSYAGLWFQKRPSPIL